MTRPNGGIDVALDVRRAEVADLERALSAALSGQRDADVALQRARDAVVAAQRARAEGHTAAGATSVEQLLHWRAALKAAVEDAESSLTAAEARCEEAGRAVASAREALAEARAGVRAIEIVAERRAREAARTLARRQDDA